jgi:beta-glucosidase
MQNNYNANKVRAHLYRVNVTNTGTVLGNDVVLAFITPPTISITGETPPIKKLFGFERVRLDVGQTTQVYFPLNVESLLTVARDGSKWLERGSYKILIGKQHMHTIHLIGKPSRWL